MCVIVKHTCFRVTVRACGYGCMSVSACISVCDNTTYIYNYRCQQSSEIQLAFLLFMHARSVCLPVCTASFHCSGKVGWKGGQNGGEDSRREVGARSGWRWTGRQKKVRACGIVRVYCQLKSVCVCVCEDPDQ